MGAWTFVGPPIGSKAKHKLRHVCASLPELQNGYYGTLVSNP
jgi:hypothetical protein